jgi:hypothetical protein
MTGLTDIKFKKLLTFMGYIYKYIYKSKYRKNSLKINF